MKYCLAACRGRENLIRLTCLTILLTAVTCSAQAQKQSVNPEINKAFENPQVGAFVERFEKEGREIYDKREQVVKACGIKKGMVIADVGAGTGLYTRLFAAQTGPEGRVYAVDIAPKFVEHVLKTSHEQGLNNVVGIVCKPDSAELPADSVDLVFICDTYHHFEYPQSTMQSIAKAMRPHGTLCLIDFERIKGVSSDWTLNHVRAGKEVFRKEIEDAGFECVGEVKLFKQNYFLKFRKK